MKRNDAGRNVLTVAMLVATCVAAARAEDVPRDQDLKYPEYAPKDGDLVISRAEYEQKLYGFWLGESIANWTGLRTENKRTTMPYFTDDDWGKGERVFVLIEKPGVWGADDDTDIEYIYQSILDVNNRSIVTSEQIAEGWLKHIEGNRYIWVSNRAAVNLMRKGILPPETSNPQNNKDYDQIDAQLTTEIFGLFAPARPDVALKMAHMPIRTTAFTNAEWISEFYVIMHSLASRVDPKLSMKEKTLWLAERARKRLPAESFPAKMYDFVKKEYDSNPDRDNWEKTRDSLHNRYVGKDTDGYKYRWHIDAGINFGASLVSLFYGEGDYKRTVRIGALCGWDSDNPTATWGGLLGFMIGREGVEKAFPDKNLSGLYRIGRTRINFPDRTPDLPGDDSFESMARRGVFVVDRVVMEEMGGGVDLKKNVWYIPNPTEDVIEAEFKEAK